MMGRQRLAVGNSALSDRCCVQTARAKVADLPITLRELQAWLYPACRRLGL